MSDVRLAVSADDVHVLEELMNVLVAQSRSIVETTRNRLTVETKTDQTLVTETDRHIESRIREVITREFPDHGILGEEYGQENPTAEFQWVVDPIDGTEEFVAGLPLFGSIIGLFFKGKPLLASIDHPAPDVHIQAGFKRGLRKNGVPHVVQRSAFPFPRMVTANRKNFLRHDDDERVFEALHAAFPNARIFSSCYAHTTTVLGAFDLGVEWNVQLWDVAATELLITEAGGMYRDCSNVATGPDGMFRVLYGKHELVERAHAVITQALR